ncbi:MAG: pyrroline-5-carboxylate reductase [Alphaproteobacteria bacterium]|jgi:pyrroline-5-carboxylate reductase|nr:pyrroline-5-carboxylate reductase [Candidatus Jidaibacter sp.]
MKILFIGCGNMGGAIAQGMLEHGGFDKSQIDVLLPSNSPHIEEVGKKLGVAIHLDHFPQNTTFDAILFAVKPQTLSEILESYRSYNIPASTLIISIAAGKTLKFFEQVFTENPVVRLMPNINILFNHGVTGAICNTKSTKSHEELVEKMIGKISYLHWFDREDAIDDIIPLSGSSPAYFFLFTEYLIKFAQEKGIPQDVATDMAVKTLLGSAEMIKKSGKSLSELRESVTSHKGSTQASLDVFYEKDALYNLMANAMSAAVLRSKELSK